MDPDFRWNDWNLEHIARHGVEAAEAEYVIRHARPPYPRFDRDAWRVWGQTALGEYLQVIYVEDPEPVGAVYVIHARPLTQREKGLYRKHRR